MHHPDSPTGRNLAPDLRRSRFQAITAAYDTLRGKRSGGGSNGGADDVYRQELERRRRARAAYEASLGRGTFSYEHHSSGKAWEASADDRWKDRIILFVGIMVRTPRTILLVHMILTRRTV